LVVTGVGFGLVTDEVVAPLLVSVIDSEVLRICPDTLAKRKKTEAITSAMVLALRKSLEETLFKPFASHQVDLS
jgi:hypothetical protein